MAGGLKVEREKDGDLTVLRISGTLDDSFQPAETFEGLTGRVVFDLSGLERITSAGLEKWTAAVKALPRAMEKEFVRLSIATVEQVNMVYEFTGNGKVRSFYAPYYCAANDQEYEMLLEVDKHFRDHTAPEAPELPCPDMPAEMMDYEEDGEYLSFLAEQFRRESREKR
ncbi:MAG: STAS domain-containing protein [Planctomycetes bacterium]|nr:STAS domain-containing protein [Planctomycetota bacterium]